ncbi:hypothetical protein [Chitinophaga sp. S165]|uniref:hypothetical protein n=1 Tax=Chitinophaga sp. S165 TaxID=2135462 RepID=UPI000D9701D4|nr:hypothetical protein [Chitinophaga sp. S165]PWV55559.1 hypothetical protein C7475_10165 [Chitinophaga sp. S165]
MSLARNLITFCVLLHALTSSAQTPFKSETIIKYDVSNHTTDKPIPFDRPFTLVVEKVNVKDPIAVHAYEAQYQHGNRSLHYISCPGGSQAVYDVALQFTADSGTLKIFFPALKPNKLFDINIMGRLSPADKEKLFEVNTFYKLGKGPEATEAFKQLRERLTDKFLRRTYLALSAGDYRAFYDDKMASSYDFMADASNFSEATGFTLEHLQAVDLASSHSRVDYHDAHFLAEILKKSALKDVQFGLVDISKAYADNKAELAAGHIRLKNLESNLKFFDTLQRQVDRLIAKNEPPITIGAVSVSFSDVRTKVQDIRTKLTENQKKLKEKMKAVTKAIDENELILQGLYLAGNTVSSDLKTAGGNVLFIDAGLANILMPGLTGKATYIPRLYWGVSIYFRPIDKNTRRSRFPAKRDLDANQTDGPDYNIVTRRSVWQHLCLNVGITVGGSLSNKDFDNFYNNTSLLVGPAWRFARAFKISAGGALMKRSSKNPLVSDKKVVPGGYASLSVDIDFIQGLKDITSILFK